MSENQKTNAEFIYRKLVAAGLTPECACGVIGNLDCESNLYACRMQGDFTTGFTRSAQYAAAVDNGSKSKETFMRDGIGWGLYQLTYFSRKGGYFDHCKANGCSIADIGAQVDYMIIEFKRDNASLWAAMKSGTMSMYDATSRVCKEFERPAVNNIDARYQSAQKWYSYLKDTPAGGDDVPTPDPAPAPAPEPEPKEDTSDTPFWPPRGAKGGPSDPGLCKGMLGCDVMLLQVALTCQGYGCTADGIFGKGTDEKVRQYQADTETLDVDGIVGPMTWESILTY